MLAHNLKEILSIVPELKEHIKQANIEEEFPLDNKDGCIASIVRCYYLSKVACVAVDPEIIERLTKAAQMYGINGEAAPYIQAIKKYAEVRERNALAKAEALTVKQAEAVFEGNLTGFFDVEKTSQEAKNIMEKYAEEVTSPEVKRYAGKAYFNKIAAMEALEARAAATGKQFFTKIAEIVNKTMDYDSPQKDIIDLCERVTKLDKVAGLSLKGFNFYKEALSVAPERIVNGGLTVKIAGKVYPYEKIERLGKHRIGQYIGKDVADEMTSDPVLNKRIIESLPLDLQRVMVSLLKHV